MILSDESFGKTLNSQIFPGIQGGPLMHIVAAKAVAFGEALRPRFKDYQAQVLRNTVTLGEELKNAKFNLVSGGTDNHLLLVDLDQQGHHRQGRRARPRRRRHHREQEHRAFRDPFPVRDLRHPHRNARAHDPRFPRAGHG